MTCASARSGSGCGPRLRTSPMSRIANASSAASPAGIPAYGQRLQIFAMRLRIETVQLRINQAAAPEDLGAQAMRDELRREGARSIAEQRTLADHLNRGGPWNRAIAQQRVQLPGHGLTDDACDARAHRGHRDYAGNQRHHRRRRPRPPASIHQALAGERQRSDHQRDPSSHVACAGKRNKKKHERDPGGGANRHGRSIERDSESGHRRERHQERKISLVTHEADAADAPGDTLDRQGLEYPERLEDRGYGVDRANREEYCEQRPRAAALKASRSAKRQQQPEQNQHADGVERHGAARRDQRCDQRAADCAKE